MSNLSVFAGVGGSLTGANHDTLTVDPSATGISITGVQLTLGALTHGTTTYTGLELSAGAVTLHGFDSAFPLYISNVHVIVNRASTGGPIDWSTVDGLGFSLSDTRSLDVRATLGIDLGGGTVVAAGTVHLTELHSGTAPIDNVDVLKLEVTGGSLFAGVGGSLTGANHDTVVPGSTGFSASGVTLDYVSATSGLGTVYRGIRLQADTVSLVGIAGVTMYVSALDVQVNTASTGPALDWSTISGLNFGLSSGTSLDVKATVGVDLGGGTVVAAGTLHLSKVHSSSLPLNNVDILELEVTGGSLFAGVGGSLTGADHATVSPGSTGFSASGVHLVYVSATSGLTVYRGIRLQADTVSLVGITGVTMYVSALDVQVNTASTGPALDWSTVSALTFGLSTDTSLDVQATVGVDLGGGTVVAAGTLHLSKVSAGTLLSSADVLKLEVTGGSLFVGIGGSADRRESRQRSRPARPASRRPACIWSTSPRPSGLTVYRGIRLQADTVSLVGITGVTLYVSALDVQVNTASTGPAFDWSSISALNFGLSTDTSLDVLATVGVDIGGGTVVAAGTLHLSKVSAGTLLNNADVLKLEVTGGSLFVGIGGSLTGANHDTVTPGSTGFSASGVHLVYVTATDGLNVYRGIRLQADTVSLVGITGVTMYVRGARCAGEHRVDRAGVRLVVDQRAELRPLDRHEPRRAGDGRRRSGRGTVVAAGTLHLSKVSAGTLLSNADVLKLEVTGGSLFVGIGGSLTGADHATVTPGTTGFSASGVHLVYVTATAGLTVYRGIRLQADTVSLVGITGVTLYVSALDVQVNTASTGPAFDWSSISASELRPLHRHEPRRARDGGRRYWRRDGRRGGTLHLSKVSAGTLS